METIKKAILLDLKQGKRLTVLCGLKLYSTIELRKYISLLRKDGNVIGDIWVSRNKKHFKEYFLTKKCNFSKINLLMFILTSPEIIDAISMGAKLTKADAG